MNYPIPFVSLEPALSQIRNEIDQAISGVIDANTFILGREVKDFERQWAKYCETEHSVGVGSGLDALFLALKALSVGPGDEVIVPSNTFIATWLAVSLNGAKVVPVEPNKETYNIDVSKLESAITTNTKAIIPVHLYGQACEMDRILSIASRYNLYVVEDNAQAHGSKYNGQSTGSFGHINATSFYPTKNLGALGDGGAITTNHTLLAELVRTLRNYGSAKKNNNQTIGINSRLDELQASVLKAKIKYLDQWNDQRKRIAQSFIQGLADIPDLILPLTADGSTHVYHIFVVRTVFRDRLQLHLTEAQIGTMVHYPIPPYLQQAYQHLNFRQGDFPIADELANTSLSLPIWPGLSDDMVDHIIQKVREFFR